MLFLFTFDSFDLSIQYLVWVSKAKDEHQYPNRKQRGQQALQISYSVSCFQNLSKKNEFWQNTEWAVSKDLQDYIFDWSDVKIPEIARVEQNNKGLVAINVFEPDDVFNDEGTMPIKTNGTN